MSTNTPDDAGGVESRDSVLVEFVDPAVDFTPRPPREETLLHAPASLREGAAALPPGAGDQAMAACMLAQARALMALGRYDEAMPAAEEARRLYESAGAPAALAVCLRVAAELHQALGRPAEAAELRRREAESRRRLSA